jgi:hypothetical protein
MMFTKLNLGGIRKNLRLGRCRACAAAGGTEGNDLPHQTSAEQEWKYVAWGGEQPFEERRKRNTTAATMTQTMIYNNILLAARYRLRRYSSPLLF